MALRWRWPRAAFVACAVGVGGFFGVTTFFGPVLLALALTVYPMAVTLPLRRWVGLLALLVPVVLAAHRGEAYLGALDPVLYAELVMARAPSPCCPRWSRCCAGAAARPCTATARRTAAGRRTRSGCGSPARCTTSSATACRW